MPLDLNHYAQVARHPDGDRLVVMERAAIRARRQDEPGAQFNARRVVADFKDSARAWYGPNLKGADHLNHLEQNGLPLKARDVRRVISLNRQVSGGYLPAPHPSKPLHVVLVGGGPSSSLQVCAEIDLLMQPQIQEDLRSVMSLGGRYDIRTTLIEKEGRAEIGKGVAWSKDQEGTANNTGSESPEAVERVNRLYIDSRAKLLDGVADNPPGRAFFLQACPSAPRPHEAEPRTNRPATLRKYFGEMEHRHFEARVRAAKEDPLLQQVYRLEVRDRTEAMAVDASAPLRPKVSVENRGSRSTGSIDADLVRLNTGTPTASPLGEAQADVSRHAYIGPMSLEKLKPLLERKGLLDDNGRIKPGTRVLTGGTGLSLYDQLLLLDRAMGLTEVDDGSPLGYRVSESAKENHRGSILIASRTPGKWVSPNHALSVAWNQHLDPVSNAREQHALFLHNQGEEVYGAWQDICVATIAAATGRAPSEVRDEGASTEALLARQQQENLRHLEAPGSDADKTMYGARRQAYLSTKVGMGLERDFRKAAVTMGEAAPLTFAGRAGLLMLRGQMSAITDPDSPISENNEKLMEVFTSRMQDAASSPVPIHALAHALVEAGIARHTTGSYEDIGVDESGQRLCFSDSNGQRSEHDFFLVSPTFQREANPVERSLAGQVAPLDPKTPSAGRLGPNRTLSRQDDVPLSIESYGMSGFGVRRNERSTVGFYFPDLIHKASCARLAADLAYKRLAEQHLAAAGSLDPVGDVDAMYREVYADVEEAYRAEVETFRGDYQEAMQKAAFLKSVEGRASDPSEFRELYEAAGDPERRRELGGDAYLQALQEIPAFNPPGSKAYFGRFVDFPNQVHRDVYARALGQARDALSARQSRAA